MSSTKRGLWEFRDPLVCRILGLALDEREEGKIFKKFELEHDKRFQLTSQRHSALVHACANPCPVSKYVDKILEERFESYRKRVDDLDQTDISRLIEARDGSRDIPLAALIWFAIRHQHQDIDEIEIRVFNAIHAMEHRALRLYDVLSRTLPSGEPESVVDELKESLRLNDKLQKNYQRSEQKREQLKAEMEAIKGDKLSLTLALAEQRQQNESLRNDLARLGGKSSLEQIELLKEENDLLTQEIKTLTEELINAQIERIGNKRVDLSSSSKVITEDESLTADSKGNESDINLPPALNGKGVAFVGGLQTLLPHYQQVVECMGGIFYAHSGKYTQGAREIENLVGKADVVFCPVDINSHHACRHVKKVCKLTGKACCFLRSSSLSMFRRELIEFTRGLN